LSHDGKIVTEDHDPDSSKLEVTKYGYLVHNVTGIRAHIISRLDGKGYDISRRASIRSRFMYSLLTCSCSVGPHPVRAGQLIFVDDQRLVGTANTPATIPNRVSVLNLRFFIKDVDPMFQVQTGTTEGPLEVTLSAHTAQFGGDPSIFAPDHKPMRFGHQDGARLVQDHSNQYGCHPYEQNHLDETLLVDRGECTFLEKLINAKEAGASGVIVINDSDIRVSPSIDDEEKAEVGEAVDDVALVIMSKTAGKTVADMIKRTQDSDMGQVMFTVDPESRQAGVKRKPTTTFESSNDVDKLKDDIQKVLYLNGHALVNTRLVIQ
jgi:mannosidase alpha-like ER degradation enhancer 1